MLFLIMCCLLRHVFVVPSFANDVLSEEFSQLNKSRELRKELMEYLKSEGFAEETEQGTLKADNTARPSAKKAIQLENEQRLRQFAIIGLLENKSADDVGKNFAQRLGVKEKEASERTLLLHGSNTVGASLAPALVESFLKFKRAEIVRKEQNGVETKLFYRDNSGQNAPLKYVEIGAYGSETAFAETEQHKGVGLKGKHCDIGMSSRPIKDEEAEQLKADGMGDLRTMASAFPIALDGVAVIVNHSNPLITQLTVDQISRIFSGEIKQWSEIGGRDGVIALYTRDDQSGTYDTFKSKVLKPYKRALAKEAKRFENSNELVRDLANDPCGIGFVGLPYVDSTVKLLAVQAGNDTRPLAATRLTVKSLDYPLSRLLYFYAPAERSTLANEFLTYAMTNEGQAVADAVGLVGQGKSIELDKKEAKNLKEALLADSNVPPEYKAWIAGHSREEISTNIRFESGKLEPDINSTINLQRLARYISGLSQYPSEILLIGFADNVGNDDGNLSLSRSRAEAVASVLEKLGMQNIRCEALGEAMPVADNSTEEGRSSNRRVEIWLKY